MESLQRCVLHRIAEIFWDKDFVPKNPSYTTDTGINYVVQHSKKVQKRIFKSLGLPTRLLNEIICAVTCLQQGYGQILVWEWRYSQCITDTSRILFPHCSIYGQFINPHGHFNDVACSRRIVTDETQPLENRFKLACYYCFEEDIMLLYSALKMKYNSRTMYVFICPFYTQVITCQLTMLWAQHFDACERNPDNKCDFQFEGVITSAEDGHEHAARFFWARCSEAEKSKFLSEKCLSICKLAIIGNHIGVVQFLYTLLTPEMKMLLRHNSAMIEIWSYLLVSHFSECVVDDIRSLLPVNRYRDIFSELTGAIYKLQIPRHIEIFKMLWRQYPFEKSVYPTNICAELARSSTMDVLEVIIQSLSDSNKEKIILNNLMGAGTSTISEFAKMGDFKALFQYLSYFTEDNLLERFLKKHPPTKWLLKMKISETNKFKTIQIIRGLIVKGKRYNHSVKRDNR